MLKALAQDCGLPSGSLELNGTRWAPYQGVLLPEAPPHQEITLSAAEQKELLRRSKAYFLRWTSHWDCPRPTGFWYIIKDAPTPLEDYPTNTRRDIRRGLRRCSVRPMDRAALSTQGYAVYRQAFLRYKQMAEQPVSQDEFKQDILSLPAENDFWGVSVGEQLVAYAICAERSGVCEYAAMKFEPTSLKDSCSYALIHTLNDYYLGERRLRYVTNGARSLSHATNFNDFLLEKFLFRKAYCQLHVAYSPRVHWAVRLLFPFRRVISEVPQSSFRKVAVLLKHEEVRRTFLAPNSFAL